jgi:hypothetical protein
VREQKNVSSALTVFANGELCQPLTESGIFVSCGDRLQLSVDVLLERAIVLPIGPRPPREDEIQSPL